MELHVFGDASENAYEKVAYVRIKKAAGSWDKRLVCSMTRVAPLPKKKISLPRLELLS